MSDEELLERFIPALKKFNPEFSREWVNKIWVYKTNYAQPVPLVNHSKNIPSHRNTIERFVFCFDESGLPMGSRHEFCCRDWKKSSKDYVGGLMLGRFMTNAKIKWISGTILALLVVLGGVLMFIPGRFSTRGKSPNIVLILTDDMDSSLLPYMKHTNELIAIQGAVFSNFFVTTPLCCPARSSIFRGQYAHNTNIMENTPGFRNFFRNGFEEETIATWLNKSGYQTALIGKYLNGYPVTAGRNYVPPGPDGLASLLPS